VGLVGRLAGIVPNHLAIAWWGLVRPRVWEKEPLLIVQGVVLDGQRVLLGVRSDLHGWELPGGTPRAGESEEAAVCREIYEETGAEVAAERHVGDYVRTGFRPHTARVFLCRATGGALRPSAETLRVRWFPIRQIPDTLFPWYRAPLEDALAGLPGPVERHEYQGGAAVWAGMKIDFRMRVTGDRAGSSRRGDP
jgi:ADP-ribose pyrophosphatase YjhB (NUDIX family)